MRLSGLLVVFTIAFAGCASYIQVFETTSVNVPIQDGRFVYEDDSVKVVYTFWKKKGLMAFDVFNKLDVPVYIDWKKSSFVYNDYKMDYWVD